MAKTVIFGGTFNPFHNGHLEIVNALKKIEGVEMILVVPTSTPPHKAAPDLVSAEHRINMCRRALEGVQGVCVSNTEIERGGRSYTYDTVMDVKAHCCNDVYISCGGDMITGLHAWYRYEDLIKECGVIAFKRVGVDGEDFDSAVEKLKADGCRITVIDCDITDVSSTEIRNGKVDKIPAAVLEYIRDNNLYGGI